MGNRKRIRSLMLLVCALPFTAWAEELSVQSILLAADGSVHTQQIDASQRAVIDHEVGLGAMQKFRGVWRFKDSARHNGLLSRYTWQIIDGFSSAEVLQDLQNDLLALPDSQLLFSCDGRACGRANQWANRVFGQRLLYGKNDEQRYRVIEIGGEGNARVLLYSGARTADRQYLQADYLLIQED